MRPARSPQTGSGSAPLRRVVVVGGGAAGTLATIQLLRRGDASLQILVVEPREAVGFGVAFGTPDPWHRLNVPAITMAALPDDPEHFVRWGGLDPLSFPARQTFGRYLQAVIADSATHSAATWRHVRGRATRLADAGGRLVVEVSGGDDGSKPDSFEADAVVVGTGNALPRIPGILADIAAAGDPRLIVDPWAPAALDPVHDGEVVGILGTGHTALDLCASILRTRPHCLVVAFSRHGELPRVHEDPWRPRPPEPLFDVEAFRGFADPFEETVARIRAHPDGWRQGMDSLRPLHQSLWLALGDEGRRRFAADWHRTWELHRSRISAPVLRDVEDWVGAGRLEVRSMTPVAAVADETGIRLSSAAGELMVGRLLLATGPDERPAATPFLAKGIADGWLRDGPLGLGIDADPTTLRVRDAAGSTPRPVYALGPILRGLLFETIAIPEIRAQAAAIAEAVAADGG